VSILKKSIRDFKLSNKRVIIRSDLNVPIKEGQIIDDTRIKKSIETIEYALKNNAKVIILSHLGRVKTKEDKEKNNLAPVAKRLEELLNKKVTFIETTDESKIKETIDKMESTEIVLLQNTRYYDLQDSKESNCEESLAKFWSSLGDIFINDAFGTLHRKHASNVGISMFLPSGIGLLVEKEIKALDELEQPDKPFIIILGGSKVEDKIRLIENLIPTCDKILIGGGMAFTFLQADGYEVGNSIIDHNSKDFCSKILKKYEDKVILPIDVICNSEFKDVKGNTKDINEIEFNEMGLDIGPKTVQLYKKYLSDAKTVLWNGPLGVYEFENYSHGTDEILTCLTQTSIKTIVAGGDIVAAASKKNYTEKLYHVSTGGGATLKYLEKEKMPGLEYIEEV